MRASLKDRILLVNPPYSLPWTYEGVGHLGLGYISSYLKSKGYRNVEIISGSFSELNSRLETFQPHYVGISVPFTVSYPNALKAAMLVRMANDTTIVVMGGCHPSACPEEVSENECVDYVVKGEGEEAFLLLLEGIESPIIERRIKDLDALPFPDRPEFNKERVGIVTSRGCPFNCSFCSVRSSWGSTWRARSPENVIKEIKSLNVPFISFEDDNLTLDRDRSERLFSLLKECKVQWNTPNGLYINSLDKDLLKLMRDSGCVSVNLAIESGDDFIRNKVVGKNLKRGKIKEVVADCRELGILTLAYFVIGMPLETFDSMCRSLEFAQELMPDAINVMIATPYPGSRLYDDCVAKNYLLSTDYSTFNVQTDCVIETPYLKAEDVKKFRGFFLKEFALYHDAHSPVPTEEKRRIIRRRDDSTI
jgi:magnesium-protoporphyrin IX monomethyl ester (oxidative) cyclase